MTPLGHLVRLSRGELVERVRTLEAKLDAAEKRAQSAEARLDMAASVGEGGLWQGGREL